MNPVKYWKRKPVIGWAIYDWANSGFATTVMVAFFPVLFKSYYAKGMEVTESTAKLGMANSLATLFVALLVPVLGAAADKGTLKKRFLTFAAFFGAVSTVALSIAGQGDWHLAAILFALASIGFGSSISFNDSLLNDICEDSELHKVSALGYALGYLGGGILFAINLWMVASPATFGIADSTSAVKWSFVSVGIWWMLFSIPVLLWVKEPQRGTEKFSSAVKNSWKELRQTISNIKLHRQAFVFLIAYLIYNDGVGTTIKMAVDFGLSIGLDSKQLPMAILMVQFVGFPLTILFGWLASKFHPKTAIYICLSVYVCTTLWAIFMSTIGEFFAMAAIIGCVQGGVQSVSRSYFAQLIPKKNSGEFFGFFNMLGRFSGLTGPLLMAGVGLMTGSSRAGLAAVALMFVVGGFILSKVHREDALSV